MKYFILDANKHNSFDFTNSPNQKESVVWNLDKTKFIVKFEEGKIPQELTNGLTNEEVLDIIRNPDHGWIDLEQI
jgi:hypothetical protein